MTTPDHAIYRAVDTVPIYGWVPCAAGSDPTTRRSSYGLHQADWDFISLIEPGGIIHRHMEFGVDGLFIWLPFGNPSTNRFQSFDAWLTLSPLQQRNVIVSLLSLEEECKRRGMTRRNIYYIGSIRGESFKVPKNPEGELRDMSDGEALEYVFNCLGPLARLIDCDIAFDNTGKKQDNPIAERALVAFEKWMRARGRRVITETTAVLGNEAMYGWPSTELEQLHTASRAPWAYEHGDLIRIVPGGSIRRWTEETDVANWPIDGAMVLRDCARRSMELRRECGLAVAWDHVAGAKSAGELRAKAKNLNTPTPYWRTA